MKRYAMLITFVFTLFLSVSLVFSQPMGKGMRPDFDSGKRLMKQLDLSIEQMNQMKKLRLEHQKEMLPIQTKIKTARLEMETLKLDQADQNSVEKKIEDIGKLKIELQKKRYAHHQAVREILTDEQKAIFDSLPKKMGRHSRGFPKGPRSQHPRN